jgi:hypothetical protein
MPKLKGSYRHAALKMRHQGGHRTKTTTPTLPSRITLVMNTTESNTTGYRYAVFPITLGRNVFHY